MFAKSMIPASNGVIIVISLSAGEVEEFRNMDLVAEEEGQPPLPADDKLINRVIEQVRYLDDKKSDLASNHRNARRTRNNGSAKSN